MCPYYAEVNTLNSRIKEGSTPSVGDLTSRKASLQSSVLSPPRSLVSTSPPEVKVRFAKCQGGITCGAIDEPRKSSKAIDERVIINFRNKNVVIERFRDKNVVIAHFRDKNVVI